MRMNYYPTIKHPSIPFQAVDRRSPGVDLRPLLDDMHDADLRQRLRAYRREFPELLSSIAERAWVTHNRRLGMSNNIRKAGR